MEYFTWQTIIRIALVYVMVAAIAAGIAYLANQLGRQIGKRKMSILHMRPRYTSILITTVTGAAIALTTLTVFAFLSEPVRALLTGLEKLRAEEAGLRRNVAVLKRTITQGSFVWRVDEPIVHMTIPCGMSYERTRAAVTSLLAEANARTILRNNQIAAGKNDKPLPVSEVLIDYNPEHMEDLVNEVCADSGMMGLRVLAAQNCLYRTKSNVRLEYWKVHKVFSAGDVIFKGTVSSDQFMLDFFRFVEDTKAEAIAKGMRPIDGNLGGELDTANFERIQDEAAKGKGTFELWAVVNRDLYETSSLDIRIEVHNVKGAGRKERDS